MSGKDKRSPPDTGGGSHLEESTKGATSSGRRVLPSVVATLSGRRVLPNVGRSSDVEETDRKFDEAACSDNHQTSSSRADDSTDSNLKGKKKGSFVSNTAQQFSSEQTTDTHHQLKPKTHLYEKGEKKKQYPEQGKNESKVCLSNLEDQGSKENLKIHVNKDVEGFSTSASAGKCVKGENLSKSFVVVNSDGEDGLQVIVVALDKKKIAIDVKPDETVAAVKEKLMDKIACETEDFCLNLDGERLDDKHTVKSYNIHPNSKIMMMRQRRKGGNKEKMHPLSSTDEHRTGATDEHGTGATDEHGTGATDEHGTGTDQADDSDEEVQYGNTFDESTGNPLEFTEGLVSIKTCDEGSILQLTCSVNKQDMKPAWYKDGRPLEKDKRTAQIWKDLTHILEIQNVSQSDAGEYRVRIENPESASKVTVKDAKKLENMSNSEFIPKGYGGKKSYTQDSLNFPKAKDLQPEDKDDLKKIHVNIDEATGKIETLTTYQLKCAKAILAKYDKQEVTEIQEDIHDNELVTIDNIYMIHILYG